MPGLIEWPARLRQPRSTRVRASTSDLLPTLAALAGQPRPNRPLDGIDLTAVLDGRLDARPTPLAFWEYDGRQLAARQAKPYLAPELQEGTTPLVKKMGGKATRDFTNYRHPVVREEDHLGTRSIIEGDLKLLVQETQTGAERIELYDLQADPAETTNLAAKQPERVTQLRARLRDWQDSVLRSLTGADYGK